MLKYDDELGCIADSAGGKATMITCQLFHVIIFMHYEDNFDQLQDLIPSSKKENLIGRKTQSHKERNCWLVGAGLLVGLLLNEKFEDPL